MTAVVDEEEYDKSEKYFLKFTPIGVKRTKEVSLPEKYNLWQSVSEGREVERECDVKESQGEHIHIIRMKFTQIVNNLTCLGDIVAHMYQDNKLTLMEFEYIKSLEQTSIRANEELLNIMANKPQDIYECFLILLKETNQNHLYQILVTEDEWNLKWLHSEHQEIIRRNFVWLSEQLVSESGFISLLYQYKALSHREKERIVSTNNFLLRNEMLLSLIGRKSPQDFKRFVEALEETSQDHIVSKLKEKKDSGDEREIRQQYALTFPRLHGALDIVHSLSCISAAQPNQYTKRTSHGRQFQRRFNDRLESHPMKNEFFTKSASILLNSAESGMKPIVMECFQNLLRESLRLKKQLAHKDSEKLEELELWRTKTDINSMRVIEPEKELKSLKQQLEKKDVGRDQAEEEQTAMDDESGETQKTNKGPDKTEELEYWKSKAEIYSKAISNFHNELNSMEQQLEIRDILTGKKEPVGYQVEIEKSEESMQIVEMEKDQKEQGDVSSLPSSSASSVLVSQAFSRLQE